MNTRMSILAAISFLLMGVLVANYASSQASFAISKTTPSTALGSTATNPTQKTISSLPPPFNGKSVKVLLVTGFYNTKQWQAVDNLTANGYDIKSVIPRETVGKQPLFFVILQSR